jgi:hypothetical protein
MYLNEEVLRKWQPVLEHDALTRIGDPHRKAVTAVLLENTERALRETRGYAPTSLLEAGVPGNQTGSAIDNYDPVLISLVRRTMPNLIAYDVCGVQPMTGPTGLIFAMRTRYGSQGGDEAFYNEANTAFAGRAYMGTSANSLVGGANSNIGNAGSPTGDSTTFNFGGGASTSKLEQLGASGNTAFNEMAFSIEKVTVTAKGRALKAEYTLELAQDLKAIHGLDAETELANILSTEIMAEINREVVRSINLTAVRGANTNVTTQGTFDLDTDSNGRWMVEKFKGLMFQIEREANQIAKDTRRGKGNILLCSSDVASALQMAGVLDYAPALNSNNLQVDDTGNTFAGVLNGRVRVYIDPYATSGNYMTVGYKGSSAFDAGLFYCPYVPLQMVRAVGEDNFQPRIGFKTRYGMAPNPFAKGTVDADANATLEQNSNLYYRRVAVSNLM